MSDVADQSPEGQYATRSDVSHLKTDINRLEDKFERRIDRLENRIDRLDNRLWFVVFMGGATLLGVFGQALFLVLSP